MNDWITIISVIGALICSIATVTVNLILGVLANKSAKDNLEAEFYRKQKAAAIHEFVNGVGDTLFRYSLDFDTNRFGENVGQIYLYAPEELWGDIDRLLELYPFVRSDEQEEGLAIFKRICKRLKEDSPRGKKKSPIQKNKNVLDQPDPKEQLCTPAIQKKPVKKNRNTKT